MGCPVPAKPDPAGAAAGGRRLSAWLPVLALIGPLVATAVPAVAEATDDAIAAVQRIYAETLAAAAAPDRLSQVLGTTVDLDALAQSVLGTAWESASAAERQDFAAVLRDVIAVELGRRIRTDGDFVIAGVRALGGADVVVLSRIGRTDGGETRLDWKMRPCGASFCVFDLIYNNVSFRADRRDDYAARLAALGGSVTALTAALRADIDRP